MSSDIRLTNRKSTIFNSASAIKFCMFFQVEKADVRGVEHTPVTVLKSTGHSRLKHIGGNDNVEMVFFAYRRIRHRTETQR
ncbi:MAG: hypothetical protein HY018_09095 [Hydrogenophilales bacterium]|nr:hypothetical protein [Hydrogenophilales bacterium]